MILKLITIIIYNDDNRKANATIDRFAQGVLINSNNG